MLTHSLNENNHTHTHNARVGVAAPPGESFAVKPQHNASISEALLAYLSIKSFFLPLVTAPRRTNSCFNAKTVQLSYVAIIAITNRNDQINGTVSFRVSARESAPLKECKEEPPN